MFFVGAHHDTPLQILMLKYIKW